MPAPSAYTRRQFPGAAVDTTIVAGINNSVTSLDLASASGWPTGAYTGGVLCELYSTSTGATAEKVWATDLTGVTLTIVRAADGTSAATHAAGTGIRPVAGAVDADEANKAVSETVGQISAVGQILVGDGANSMAAVAAGTSGRILVGNGTTVASVAVSGDATLSAAGALSIGNSKITNTMMADDAIDSAEIADGAIDTVHIGDLQVTTGKLAADAVTGAKVADDAIDSEHYVDGSIDTAHLADDAVALAKMAAAAKPRWTVGPFIRSAGSGSGAMGIPVVSGTAPTQIPITEDCAIIGISVVAESARASGTGSFAVLINGVTTGFGVEIDATNPQYVTATQAETADAVTAGQRVGVSFTNSSLSPAGNMAAYVHLQAV